MVFPNNFMQITIKSIHGLTGNVIIHPNIKQIKIIPTIPYCDVVLTTYKNPNHTSSIPLFNEDTIIITPELDDKIYPQLKKTLKMELKEATNNALNEIKNK